MMMICAPWCLGQMVRWRGLSAGAILIDHTTTSAEVAREIAALCQEAGVDMLDAPVSGGEAGAVNAALTVMVGGDETVFAEAEPVIMSFARAARLMGPSGGRAINQNGQSDLHWRFVAGAVRGLELCR
jgi:3-hydroxyisobutyrate dehydrogenase